MIVHQQLPFIGWLLCAKHYTKHFTCNTLFDSLDNATVWLERLSNLAKVAGFTPMFASLKTCDHNPYVKGFIVFTFTDWGSEA